MLLAEAGGGIPAILYLPGLLDREEVLAFRRYYFSGWPGSACWTRRCRPASRRPCRTRAADLPRGVAPDLHRRRDNRLPAASMSADLPALAEQHDTRWRVTDFAAGDVMVHSPYMVHASLDNVDRQRQLRLSTDIRYQRAGDVIDWRWQQHWYEDDGL